ncbi:MAG: hypothetical protein AB7E96_01185 [Deferribacterales bacterium]
MIQIKYDHNDSYIYEIVRTAFERSFTVSQMTDGDKASVYVVINPDSPDAIRIHMEMGHKVIVFGRPDERTAEYMGITLLPYENITGRGACASAVTAAASESREEIAYNKKSPLAQAYPFSSRPFCRFDFTDEWNNMGYGRITLDGLEWAVSCAAVCEDAFASFSLDGIWYAFALLKDTEKGSLLWVNRAVGWCDSVEWNIIEYFISAYRYKDIATLPYLLDIPAGCASAVTMRLDCDEHILSSKRLFELYRERNIPFTLAVKTSLELNGEVRQYFDDILAAGGAILSHSINHKCDWGSDFRDAVYEGAVSRTVLERFLGMPVNFAVSPFHQNSPKAVCAVKNAGYRGFIGGIIHNDPEYLLSRGGAVPFVDGIASHSQQCMLHGDCPQNDAEDELYIYKNSYNSARQTSAFFGYLDHPQSAYDYGWKSFDRQCNAHMDYLDFLQASEASFFSAAQCLEFMCGKKLLSVRDGVLSMNGENSFGYTFSEGGRMINV